MPQGVIPSPGSLTRSLGLPCACMCCQRFLSVCVGLSLFCLLCDFPARHLHPRERATETRNSFEASTLKSKPVSAWSLVRVAELLLHRRELAALDCSFRVESRARAGPNPGGNRDFVVLQRDSRV